MSRWIDDFNNHPFQKIWKEITKLVETISAPGGSTRPNIMELSRFKKIIRYIDELLIAVDPELVPAAVWDNINIHAPNLHAEMNAFNSNLNFAHITNANSHADTVLGLIMPYIKPGKGAAQAAGRAFKEYSDTVEEFIGFLKSDSESTVNDIREQKKIIDTSIAEISASKLNIQNLENMLLIDSEKEISLQSRLNALETEAIEWHSKISGYHQRLTLGTEEENAIVRQIEEARKDALAGREHISKTINTTMNATKNLSEFYETITGKTLDGHKVKDGLEDLLAQRNKELDDFAQKQKTKYTTLNNQIESLIPGATSAGLATAYQDQKKSYKWPIVLSNALFFVSIGALIFVGLTILFDFSFLPKFAPKLGVGIPLVSAFLNRLPITLPLVWLAYTASKRRSEYARLKQEYAHKEALVKSFQSFKKQIDDLGENSEKSELLIKFLGTAIDTISYNASATLDGKHGEKMPLISELKEVLNSAKGLMPKL